MPTEVETGYELPVEELARWVERQADRYWSASNDPDLMGRLPLPNTGARVAAALRKIRRSLTVYGRPGGPTPPAGPLTADDLDGLTRQIWASFSPPDGGPRPAWMDDRSLVLRWEGGKQWSLSEDSKWDDYARRRGIKAG